MLVRSNASQTGHHDRIVARLFAFFLSCQQKLRSHRYSQNILYGAAILLNVAVSYGMLWYRQPFNVDGILYLNAAQVYLQQGLHAAMQVYPWPFYSILIATISKMFHISLLSGAFSLNAVFTSILVVFFLLVIRIAHGSRTTQYWGLAVILLYPYLNHDRCNILRDFGYYAFFFVSLWCFAVFLQKRSSYHAFFWQIAVMLATAFRIEGVVLLSAVPFMVLCFPDWSWRQKYLSFIKLIWFAAVLGLITLLFYRSFWHFGRMPALHVVAYIQQITGVFQQKVASIQQYVFDVFGKDEANVFLLGGLVALFLVALLDTLGVFSTIVILYAIYNFIKTPGVSQITLRDAGSQKEHRHAFCAPQAQTCFAHSENGRENIKPLRWNAAVRYAITSYGLIVSLTLMLFLVQQLFLSSRYVVPLALLLMLVLPFTLQTLWEKQGKFIYNLIVILFLLFNAVASFGQYGPSKTYIINAGEWLDRHTPDNATVYTNDPQLAYYAQRAGTRYPQDFPDQYWLSRLQQQNLNHYNYVAIVLRRNEKLMTEQQLIQFLGRMPVKVFQNKRDDKAYIFQTATGARSAG